MTAFPAFDFASVFILFLCHLQQFKVGQAVGALKPCLNNESEVSAIAAIQELEGLAALDISAPFTFEAPQPQVLQS